MFSFKHFSITECRENENDTESLRSSRTCQFIAKEAIESARVRWLVGLDELKYFYNSMPNASKVALLLQNLDGANSREILKLYVKPHFQQETWDAKVIKVLQTVILNTDQCDHLFPLMIPPVMTLLEHHIPKNKITGALLLDHIISKSTCSRLRENNICGVFVKALTDTSRWIDQPLLMHHSLKGLIELRKSHINQSKQYLEYLENIVKEGILRNHVYSTDIKSTIILIENSILLVDLLGLHSFKFMNQFIDISCEYLLIPATSNLCVELLLVLINNCWAGIDVFLGKITVAVAESWRLNSCDRQIVKGLIEVLIQCGAKNDFEAVVKLDLKFTEMMI
jgi:hypothetical protein